MLGGFVSLLYNQIAGIVVPFLTIRRCQLENEPTLSDIKGYKPRISLPIGGREVIFHSKISKPHLLFYFLSVTGESFPFHLSYILSWFFLLKSVRVFRGIITTLQLHQMLISRKRLCRILAVQTFHETPRQKHPSYGMLIVIFHQLPFQSGTQEQAFPKGCFLIPVTDAAHG